MNLRTVVIDGDKRWERIVPVTQPWISMIATGRVAVWYNDECEPYKRIHQYLED